MTPSDQLRRSTRILELDALRAMAAINLLVFHFTYLYQNKYGYSAPLGLTYPYGKYGVQLFFMLSGLVNAMTLLSKHRSDDFLAARLIRICPPFWAAMLVNVGLVAVMPLAAHPPSASQWLANLTIVPGLWGQECIEPVTWTLQVELLFYMILLTWFSLGALRRPLFLTGATLAVVAAGCFPLKLGWLAEGSVPFAIASALNSVLILETLPLFLIGILLNERRCGRGTWFTHGAAIAACGFVFHLVDLRDYNPAGTVLFTALLGFSAFGRVPVLRLKPIAFVAGISYSLYLLHNNLGSTLIYQMDPWIGPWPALIAASAVVFAVATASTYWFERPLGKWLRDRWFRSRRSPVEIVPIAGRVTAG
jgi:peptidoglycan/LPS O-acetylase OafA/YrhL